MSYEYPTKKERLASLEMAIKGIKNEMIAQRALFDETRQTVFAIQDRLNQALADEAIAADMPPKSPAQLRIEARQLMKRGILDDVVSETTVEPAELDALQDWYRKITRGDLTADNISAAHAVADYDDTYLLPLFPTDEDLDKVDALIDELIEGHDD